MPTDRFELINISAFFKNDFRAGVRVECRLMLKDQRSVRDGEGGRGDKCK